MILVQEKTYYIVAQSKPDKPTTKEWVRPLWFLFTVGWYVALSVVIPTLIGAGLDSPERLDHRPLFTLIGFFLGSVIAFYGLYRMLRQFYREQTKNQKGQDKDKESE
jgi:Putative F0F1-ATPase subunit Ca2+/Mg2+ transporter